MKKKILTSKEMLHGCQITYPTLKDWVIGLYLPTLRQSPWLFDRDKVLAWVKSTKPERYEHFKQYLEMMEV